MPTYEYRCPKGHDFERFYKTISASVAEMECPECGALAARQLSGGAGLMFKGSGFYLTDYGKNAHRGGAKPGGSGGDTAAKSDAPKSDAPKSDAPKAETAPKTESKKPGPTKPKSE